MQRSAVNQPITCYRMLPPINQSAVRLKPHDGDCDVQLVDLTHITINVFCLLVIVLFIHLFWPLYDFIDRRRHETDRGGGDSALGPLYVGRC